MDRTRLIRRAAPALVSTALLTGCAATQPREVAVSDAAWNTPTFSVATADGFVVGDALGMTLLMGNDVRLADVQEPFELGD